VCAPSQFCSAACIPESGSCTSSGSCCAGSLCIYDDATQTTASCHKTCTTDSQCSSVCCAPLADGSASICSTSNYCTGSTCLPVGTRPCALGTPCCPGSYCISDAINQICLATCSKNADCPTGCCWPQNGNGVYVCSDRAFCPP
jgi:hypothetical protein